MIVRFVDIVGIDDHQCLNFLFIIVSIRNSLFIYIYNVIVYMYMFFMYFCHGIKLFV